MNIKNIVSFLKGKKTYAIAIIAGVTLVLNMLKIIPSDLADMILKFCGVGGVITMRSAIADI